MKTLFINDIDMRGNFVDMVAEIYSKAISTEVSKGGALKIPDTFGKCNTHKEAEQAIFLQELHDHVQDFFFGYEETLALRERIARRRERKARWKTTTSAAKSNKMASFSAVMTAGADAVGDAMAAAAAEPLRCLRQPKQLYFRAGRQGWAKEVDHLGVSQANLHDDLFM